MAELPSVTGPLTRYIGRLLSNKPAAEWQKMAEQEREPFFKQARKVLHAERKFLARAEREGAKGTGV